MREIFSLNNDWIYVAKNTPAITKSKFVPKLYDEVTLPHCLGNDMIYDYSAKAVKASPDGERKAGKCGSLDNNTPVATAMWYRRDIAIDPQYSGKLIYLLFEGAYGSCDVYLNGKKVYEHKEGLVPFRVNVTKYISFGKINTLAVCVDCRDDNTRLPGNRLGKSKVISFGGLHRNVKLIIKELVHFQETNYCGSHSGGIYLYNERLEQQLAVMGSKINIANRSKKKIKAYVVATVTDMKGKIVAKYTTPEEECKAGNTDVIDCSVHVEQPIFWTTNYPYLYTVKYELYADGGLIDLIELRHGFRMANVDHRGFIFNGVKTKISAVTRLAQAPYIGQAINDNAEYRDAYKIKKAGFNAVKLEGGMQSSAFIEACDELGLIVINTLPICDTINKNGEFKDNVIKAVKAMARRDRNHTSALIWEVSLSDSNKDINDKYYMECKEVFENEFFNNTALLIAGSVGSRKNPKKLNYNMPYTLADDVTNEPHINSMQGKKGLVNNYGDMELGGEYSIARVGRYAPEGAQLLQAWSYQWTHNRNLESKRVLGDILCSNVDYLQGNSERFKYCRSGLMDLYRLPKFSYQFFRSQDIRPTQRMVFAPTFWNDESINVLPVYSNCERVRIFINGEFVAERTADKGETDSYTYAINREISSELNRGKKAITAETLSQTRYWALKQHYEKATVTTAPITKHIVDTMYNGGNCKKLASAPFTFRDITYQAGELKIEGIVGNKIVARQIVNTPEDATSIRLVVDYSSRELITDANDFVYAHAEIVDGNGTIVRDFNNNIIEFSVEGGTIIGMAGVVPEGGIASCMVRGNNKAQQVIVTAICDGLEGQRVEIKVKRPQQTI